MEEKVSPVFSFRLDYANELVSCEVIMRHNHYEVVFNGVSKGTVAHTDDFKWIQESGAVLPQSIVDMIGDRIESQYE